MDTDDLSEEAYKGIILEAEKFHHDLTLQFGLLASSCETEEEYLKKAKELIEGIKKLDEYELADMFFDNPPDKRKLYWALEKIMNNISEIDEIPVNKRHYDF